MFRGIGSGIGMRPRTKAILAVAVLAVIGMLYVFSREPSTTVPDNCQSKGIDPKDKKEGTCEVGGKKQVVVNPGDLLELKTLDVRLEGMRETSAHDRPGGKASGETLVTFDLAVTNRTDAPATLDEAKVILYGETVYSPDSLAEESSATSLRFHPSPIAPGATAHGTLTFELPSSAAKTLYENGNLDFGNVGSETTDYEPQSLFSAAELGVIRTEKPG
jgi:hypothetical protein